VVLGIYLINCEFWFNLSLIGEELKWKIIVKELKGYKKLSSFLGKETKYLDMMEQMKIPRSKLLGMNTACESKYTWCLD
jgi:hypothetical protein